MMINIQQLPKEIRDVLELKSVSDQSFYRALEEDYTDIMFETLNSRSQVDSRHSMIISFAGTQGCHPKGTIIFIRRNDKYIFISIENIIVGDEVFSIKNNAVSWQRVTNTFRYNKSEVLSLKMRHGDINVTPNHKLFTIKNGELCKIEAKDCLGKRLLFWNGANNKISVDNEVEYHIGIIHGAYIADGSGDGFISKLDKDIIKFLMNSASIANIKANVVSRGVNITKSIGLQKLGIRSDKYIRDARSISFLKGVLDGYILCDSGFNISGSIKKKIEVKFVSKSKNWIEQLSMLLLYFYGIKGYIGSRVLKSGKWAGNKYYNLLLSAEDARRFLEEFSWMPGKKATESFIGKTRMQIDARSCYDKIPFDGWGIKFDGLSKRGTIERSIMKSIRRCIKDGYIQKESVLCWFKKSSKIKELFKPFMYLFDLYWSDKVLAIDKFISDVYDIEVEDTHRYIMPSGLLSSNSGKSYASIAICKTLDPNFSVDQIYFSYNDLVYNKAKLKPGMAVLVDEQSDSYGMDSHRVNIILSALKEQLRKKSIHFVFCSPTLKSEYSSSMYVLETMFLDFETQECYAAYKTRELLTLGYVRIPNPLSEKIGITKEFMEAYEAKKDEHLDRLTGAKQFDEVEERVQKIMNTELFKAAEKVYIARMGYIPMSMLFQIINKLFPEFKSSIIVGELASRIKLNKELSGEWEMSGVTKKKNKEGYE